VPRTHTAVVAPPQLTPRFSGPALTRTLAERDGIEKDPFVERVPSVDKRYFSPLEGAACAVPSAAVTDEEFAEAVKTSAATQLEESRQHYTRLIDGSFRREGLHLVFEFEAAKRPSVIYACRASALPEPDEPRDANGVAGDLFANWMEIVEADDVALPEPSAHAVTWVTTSGYRVRLSGAATNSARIRNSRKRRKAARRRGAGPTYRALASDEQLAA
jgi:hypothetical protein